ncbi:MAG: CBS domain-containing protein [Chloroflexota bacterium]|nr:CBS domain-containing protein [Chloroflexota bacterium]
MPKFVRDVMRRSVITCKPDSPLVEAARRMLENQVNALVVVDEGGEACGLISRTDLVRVYDLDYASMKVEDVMTSHVTTVIPDIPVAAAAQLMLDNKIGRLVIVHQKPATQRPVGILSLSDIVRDMAGTE